MIIEEISNGRVKVVINEAELLEHNITPEAIKNGSKHLHTFLFGLMEQIRLATHFDPFDGQVVIEATRDSDVLILIVSKVSKKRELTPEYKRRVKNAKPVLAKNKQAPVVYIFDSFSDLCDALRQIDESVLKKCELYEIDRVYYFYTLSESCAVLSEYCSRKSSVISRDFLQEHASSSFLSDTLVTVSKSV